MSDSPIRVQHIDHITLVVKSVEESRRFYVGLLGMDEVARPAFDFNGAWFQAGATLIHLIGIPVTNLSVNPARSTGPALVVGGWALQQLWLFWAAPIALVWAAGGAPILMDIAAFFSKLAVVTFGGAYAVLAYMAQDVVQAFGWLTTGEMMDGLGLAETTPGPLILVTEFVGFLAGYGEGGFTLALAAAALTLWVTFAPCFLWIFAGAPYIDWLGAQPRLAGALSAITAAVVGVILNLSLWFAMHVFFSEVTAEIAGIFTLWTPTLDTLDWRVVALTALSAVMLLGLHRGVLQTLAVAAFVGLALSAIS